MSMATAEAPRFAGPRGDIPRPNPVSIPAPIQGERPIRLAILAEGALTPLGNSADATWEGYLSGRNGIVEHTYSPFTDPSYEVADKIVSSMRQQHPMLGRFMERFGDNPRVRNFILEEYLNQNPDIKADSLKMTMADPQIRVGTAGTIKDFNPVEQLVKPGILPSKEVRKLLGSYAHYAVRVGFEALSKVKTQSGEALLVPRLKENGTLNKDYQWTLNKQLVNPLYAATFVGCGFGGGDVSADVWEGLLNGDYPDPDAMMLSLLDRASFGVTEAFEINGGGEGDVAACDSFGKAMLNAAERIGNKHAQIALVIGTEGILGRPIASAMFDALDALDRGKDPRQVSRSLHKVRNGFTIAEGALGYVVADYDWAKENNIPIIYELVGFGDTSGGKESVAPNGVAQEQAMRLARRRAEMHGPIRGKVIDSGHFTGTPLGETSEILASQNVLEDKRKATIFFGSKGRVGHLLGAAGGLSQFVAGRVLQTGEVPGMVFDGEIMDEAYGWDVPTKTRLDPEVTDTVVNQFGFGDANTSLWFRKTN